MIEGERGFRSTWLAVWEEEMGGRDTRTVCGFSPYVCLVMTCVSDNDGREGFANCKKRNLGISFVKKASSQV